jgi:hypothetical protein
MNVKINKIFIVVAYLHVVPSTTILKMMEQLVLLDHLKIAPKIINPSKICRVFKKFIDNVRFFW